MESQFILRDLPLTESVKVNIYVVINNSTSENEKNLLKYLVKFFSIECWIKSCIDRLKFWFVSKLIDYSVRQALSVIHYNSSFVLNLHFLKMMTTPIWFIFK